MCVYKNVHIQWLQISSMIQFLLYPCLNPGLRGAPGYSLEQAHYLPIEMDSLIGELVMLSLKINRTDYFHINIGFNGLFKM